MSFDFDFEWVSVFRVDNGGWELVPFSDSSYEEGVAVSVSYNSFPLTSSNPRSLERGVEINP